MYRNDRVFDPRDVRLVATIATTRDARAAHTREHARTYEDSFDFRSFRAEMQGNRGVL